MPAYSFMKRFVPYVESGAKTHTIRARRKHPPKPGQTAYLYYGLRTIQCRKLLESPIVRVEEIRIQKDVFEDVPYITIDGIVISQDEVAALARNDGFDDVPSFWSFWKIFHLAHETPFEGHVIHWRFPGGVA